MKLSPDVDPYLSGQHFSNRLVVQLLGKDRGYSSRIDFLLSLAKGKKVLHVGFADHCELIRSKIAKGTWLHGRLLEVTTRCAGLDVNSDSVELCEAIGIGDVYCRDITSQPVPEEVTSDHWDFVLLGELIEHIPRPVQFLADIRKQLRDVADSVVITAPNAWSLSNFTSACRNQEVINSDHRFWFTPYTLAKIATDAGYTPVQFHFTAHLRTQDRWYRQVLRRRFPLLRETVIGVFNFE